MTSSDIRPPRLQIHNSCASYTLSVASTWYHLLLNRYVEVALRNMRNVMKHSVCNHKCSGPQNKHLIRHVSTINNIAKVRAMGKM